MTGTWESIVNFKVLLEGVFLAGHQASRTVAEALVEVGVEVVGYEEVFVEKFAGMLTQLQRIEPGKEVEEAHMRNRKLIAEWAYEHGKDNNVIELVLER